MPTSRLERSQTTKAAANGTASISFQPYLAGESWTVRLVTATSSGLTVTVTRNTTVIDTTTGDPRPSVTSDSVYDVLEGDSIKISWSGAANGQQLTATVIGDVTVPG